MDADRPDGAEFERGRQGRVRGAALARVRRETGEERIVVDGPGRGPGEGSVQWYKGYPHRVLSAQIFPVTARTPSIRGLHYLGYEGGWGHEAVLVPLIGSEAREAIRDRWPDEHDSARGL
jgi:hypothetical protein